jgi:diguanylate cyclase (GGDEF)-like protein
MIVVNFFKEVNDRFGHHHGDAALRLVANTLKDCSVRGEIVARWGGDEFVMVCPYADEKLVEKLIRLHKEKLAAYSPPLIGPTLSVSVGSACFPEDGGDLDALVRKADKRMYEGKASTKRTPAGADFKQA